MLLKKTPNRKREKRKKAAENRQGVCGMTHALVSRRVAEPPVQLTINKTKSYTTSSTIYATAYLHTLTA
jgi:hypothetical protein